MSCHLGRDSHRAITCCVMAVVASQKYMVVLFLAMTVIATPAMDVYAQGSRMPRLVLDPIGVSQVSLGNAGDPLRSVYVQDPDSSSVFAEANATVTTNVWGWQLTSVGASYLVRFVAAVVWVECARC